MAKHKIYSLSELDNLSKGIAPRDREKNEELKFSSLQKPRTYNIPIEELIQGEEISSKEFEQVYSKIVKFKNYYFTK